MDLGDDDDASLRTGTEGGYHKPSPSQELRALRSAREDGIYASTTTASGYILQEAEEQVRGSEVQEAADEEEERPNPNINGFSAALSCYPCVLYFNALIQLHTKEFLPESSVPSPQISTSTTCTPCPAPVVSSA